MPLMLAQYFQGWDVTPEYRPEFISLWPGWLGPENYHLLDCVAESEWQRFNDLLALIASRYEVLAANLELGQLSAIASSNEITQTYAAAMTKDASQFTRIVIPELDCVVSEDWDFTYIVWHKDRTAIDSLAPLVERAGLHHFGREPA